VSVRDSDILFIYEARLTNPNGDPDEENMPRMDRKTWTNLVSDVRLKRYFRDYLVDKYGWKSVWVTKVEGRHVDATKRVEHITKSRNPDEVKSQVLENCIDARLFGATIPLKGAGGRGESISITGPVQFTWGFSLHKVDLVDSSAITSIFKGREVEAEAGTIGRDYRVYYSMIAFYGRISSKRSFETKLSSDDIKLLDKYLWESIKLNTTTRSKIGQWPLLYLRVEYNDLYSIGDLRRFISRSYSENVRDLDDVKLDFTMLFNKLSEVSDKINKIYIRIDEMFEELYGVKEGLEEIDNLSGRIEVIG